MAIRRADDPLEAWVEEATRRCVAAGCHGGRFEQMRALHGTVGAMERLMHSAEIQSGFLRLLRAGLKGWSLEAGVLGFPDRFTEHARASAKFRLDNANDPALRAR